MKIIHSACLALLAAVAMGACSTGLTISTTGTGGAGGSGTGGSGGSGGAGAGTTTTTTTTTGAGGCTVAGDCPDLNDPCATTACINGQCGKLPANDFSPCEDGKQCTENDTCQGGLCMPGSPKFCPSMDTCHLGSCDVATDMCVQVPGNDGASCNDDDACTGPGTCNNGTCSAGGPVDCSFLDGLCSEGYCDPSLGCLVKPKNDGTPCDDNLYCTIDDKCTNGTCTGAPNTCAPPGNICMIGQCNENTKTCVAVPGNDGQACDDGNLCTGGETCNNGNCLGGQPANNGQACDDKNGCTLGTTCTNGMCGSPTSQIMQCLGGDSCCPAGCGANDSDCLFWQSGVLQNVTPATLTGWSQCYSDTYNVSLQGVLPNVLQMCSKNKLLLACAPVNAAKYTLVAMGLRSDVLFDCGSGSNCTHQANGVGWYYSNNWSWGFANAGDQVQRNECDVAAGPLRLCWHTVNNAGGYRCGDITGLNGDSTWKRYVYQAD